PRPANHRCIRRDGCHSVSANVAVLAAVGVTSLITSAVTCFSAAGVTGLVACLVQPGEPIRHGAEPVSVAVGAVLYQCLGTVRFFGLFHKTLVLVKFSSHSVLITNTLSRTAGDTSADVAAGIHRDVHRLSQHQTGG